MDLYDYIWTYDILLIYIIIYYWNKYVIIMYDIDNRDKYHIQINGFLNDTYLLHVLYWQIHMEVNCVLLSTCTFILHLYLIFFMPFYMNDGTA